ncbi:DUF3613 domain-containing protein [Pseudomonas huaxiensis]|uniref:DUF3613 domain-containing protein n=1 Tax=Pseudomonas huaxiensis TaxID=2213017 RepID=UPI000DA6D983|nr:DUF3613 domain-containing protein [Pseudomonas huaxiensis]
MNVRIPLLIVLAGFSCAAAAVPEGPSSKAQETTETWLQLQPRGLHASSNPQATTPKEYDKTMERWQKVYDYKIPDVFKWEKVTSSGSQ